MALVVSDAVVEAGEMASVPDILGLTHIAVISSVQLIVALKNQIQAYQSLPTLLAKAEEKTREIDSYLTSLMDLAQVTDMKSDFFCRIYTDAQEVQQELMTVHNDFIHSSTPRRFLSSSTLVQRLSVVNDRLDAISRSLTVVGMIGDIVTRKVEQESANLQVKLHELTSALNQVLADRKTEQGTKSLLDAVRQDDSFVLGGLRTQPLIRDMLNSEHLAQLYFSLGRSYYTGEHEKGRDFFCAARYLLAAFDGGAKSLSAYYLGNLYYSGDGVEQCFKTAFEYYCVGGKLGNAESLSEIAWCLEVGHGASYDIEGAMKYYAKGAQAGSEKGMRNLGYHLLHGNATEQNYKRAARYLQNARKKGEPRVNFDLAHLYENGVGGIDRDTKEAVRLLKEGYETRESMATFYLARRYFLGIGVDQDFTEAARLFRECAIMDSFGKRFKGYYGLCLIRGLGVKKNVRAGLRMVRAGLTKGSGNSWAVYGDCYRHGYGVKQDVTKAIRYYTVATSCGSGSRGVSDAHAALGQIYDLGEGVARNTKKAVYHYISAANRFNRLSQWKAASFLESGTGVVEDMYHAFYFYDLAARGGHTAAQHKATDLYMKGFGVQRDRTRAIQLLEQAVEDGNIEAQSMLNRVRRLHLFTLRKARSH